jgi:hypothetical protein
MVADMSNISSAQQYLNHVFDIEILLQIKVFRCSSGRKNLIHGVNFQGVRSGLSFPTALPSSHAKRASE